MARKQSLRGRKKARRKSAGGSPKTGGSTVIAARIENELYDLIDFAAQIREVDRQEILVAGGRKEALRILKHSIRSLRRYKDRQRRARLAARRQRGGT